MLQTAQNAQLTHPVPVIRAREIYRWASSSQYQEIIQATGDRAVEQSKGGWRNW